MNARAQDHGPKPELKWLPVGGLKVDPKYQRDTGSRRSRNLIDKIAGSFRWSRFGVVMAVRSTESDSVWHVVDGQHRVEVARALKLPTVPVLVLPHATLAEAAADFVAINRDRVAVTPLHIHHAQLAAGEPEAQAIARVCARAKVEICRYPVPSDKMKPGQTLAVQSIARLIRLRGPDFAEKVLTALRTAPGGDLPGAMSAVAIRQEAERQGLGRLHNSYGAPAASGAQRRPCLSCSRPFMSTHKGHRLCASCAARGE
jgi:hypothetical protein